ncbi:hypothetical protein Kfla_3059 [Kribbella flavida DSM 17836]|uniref:Uncharacterized protein n=1 Tax=Kribbella flavida (strain DSM 17836 / JCM 10339 / NBRC 14399) TaxID=479435 RepID=D2Q2Z8_KRIFD|nr:DUF6463 family protein [Kribbella flavida]ADB32123.1 hypothetical protein Kfla_3059 [Kribbella flavida DSM 17836]
MSTLSRWVPRLVFGLGVVHVVYAVVESPGIMRDMVTAGVVNASSDIHRDYVTWFFIGGLATLMIAAVARWSVRVTGTLPAVLGWWMVGIGGLDTVLEPVGGGWILLLLGALTVYDARRPPVARAVAGGDGRPLTGERPTDEGPSDERATAY